MEPQLLQAAQSVLSPDLFDKAFSHPAKSGGTALQPPDGLGAFAGPLFEKDRISGYLAALSAL